MNRRPGRPRAIPDDLVPVVLRLYQGGLGYRSISRELARRGVVVDYSTIKRYVRGRGPYQTIHHAATPVAK